MRNQLPFKITKQPFDYDIDKYTVITDDSLTVNIGVPKFGYSIMGLVGIVMILPVIIFMSDEHLYSAVMIIFISLWLLGSLFLIVYEFARSRDRILIFDRANDMITMPANMRVSAATFSFSKDGIAYNQLTNAQPGVFGESLMYINKETKFGRGIGIWGVEESWSFYVWYMDKNRPFPPGNAFDPHRQKDFERRKAEGFPRPLYPSNIQTPEAKPEKQKERKKIGGW